MESIQATRLRKGTLIKLNDELYRVMDVTHLTPGKGKAFVQSRMRNVKSGSLLDHKFRSVDVVERAVLDDREMQFTYRDGDTFNFMDLETFEQVEITAETLGESVHYLLPEATIRVSLYENEAIGLNLPLTVDLKVAETAPAIKGATASAQLKPATLETGLVIQVPPFISNDDTVRVNTETGEYQSRA
ncbi:MAG: elongation factor P [Acidobacteria bacterium]|nr:elongation factor P [Acidobacteriota bacterium]|tara:strand:- start:151 stop:714 length:564 start_codon:yes stop_codon:yes gene_type:complete